MRANVTWGRVAAVIAVFATVWATFIGQTIPELLRDENAPLNTFRDKVNAICSSAESYLSSAKAPSAERLRDLQAQFAAILPPAQYTDEYEGLQRAWGNIVTTARGAPNPTATDTATDSDGDGLPDAQELSLITPGGFRAAVQFQDSAALMQLRTCRRLTRATERVISRNVQAPRKTGP